ncbi:four-helix bundle copper-binding protein [Ferruginibacter albus]|uniref:four-helix bundle copper-binding protein n=1 Tax=Ferruginibacter albus TaxID=2875540 RepID=UPI001CC754CD|nr:four-helix bundle copper-binding protein [Ferruginibacter albus]UAY51094.1 four-helix bundle copper-binding protein [Ferruginibacter albus]
MKEGNYQWCIDACLDCMVACNNCTSACLQEATVKMMKACIELNIECSIVCNAAVQVMSIRGETADELCRICADIRTRCAKECERHDMEHCKKCAIACRRCADECYGMAAA